MKMGVEKQKQQKKRKLQAYNSLIENNPKRQKLTNGKFLKGNTLADDFIRYTDRFSKEKEKENIKKKKLGNVRVETPLTEEEIKAIREKNNLRRVQKLEWAKFSTNQIYHKAALDTSTEKRYPLFLVDIQNFLLGSVLLNAASFKNRFCHISRGHYFSSYITLIVNGVGLQDLKKLTEDVEGETDEVKLRRLMPRISSLLSYKVEVIPPFVYELPTIDELVHVDLSSTLYNKIKDNETGDLKHHLYEAPVKELKTKNLYEEGAKDKFDRRQLVLSRVDMIDNSFPLPQEHCVGYNDPKFAFTCANFTELKEDSPLYSVDCEMVKTVHNTFELARVSLINEQAEVVYHSFVKPKSEVGNYMTIYSGVTKKLLKNVKTTLKDVQEAFQNILPSDAILVGHQLDSDLRALKMYHPYCIDTSIIYNNSGFSKVRPSLKVLTKMFLRRDIQIGHDGHDPTEDAVAALDLTKLKLQKDITFGDVGQGFQLETFENACSTYISEGNDSNTKVRSVFNLFYHIKSCKERVSLLSTPLGMEEFSNTLEQSKQYLTTTTTCMSQKKLSRKIAKCSRHSDFTMGLFKLDLKFDACNTKEEKLHQLKKLDKRLKFIYENAKLKSLVSVLFTGSPHDVPDSEKSNGIFMFGVKGFYETFFT